MLIDITMPQLGESVTEGTIVKWLKQPGDNVKKYEPICEIATDKVNAEVPSTTEGVIESIVVTEGTTVSVGQVICKIQASDKDGNLPSPATSESTVRNNEEASKRVATPKSNRYSPAVLRLAQENYIDPATIPGTGVGGRVTRKDILLVIERKQTGAFKPTLPPESTLLPESRVERVAKSPVIDGDIEIVMTPIRSTIGRRMLQSKHEAPHAWTVMEVDVTKLALLRNKLKTNFKSQEGISLTFMPFFIQAVVDSLREFPYLNAVWQDDRLILKKKINISVAIAKDDALYVPVIHDADDKSILGLAKSLHAVIDKVYSNTLGVDDSTGGTFTVNNTGSFGSIISYPIINHPQVAIISLEKVVKRPVVIDGMIAIRDMVNVCLSFDHKALDGFMAGSFLSRVKERLEAYSPDTTV